MSARLDGSATHSRGFHRVYQAGLRDRDDRFMGGTEIMQLVAHLGKLYAVTSTMWDRPGNDDPVVGAQILVMDHPERGWRVEHAFETTPARMSFAPVAFAVDRRGRALDTPVTLLLAGPSDGHGAIAVWCREEASGVWTRQSVATSARYTSIRCLHCYRDPITGVDRVFAGTAPNGIYSGVYDPEQPGRIVWDDAPELANYERRPMGFATCNGALYVTIKPHLYRRIDGTQPRWEQVYTLPDGVSLIGSGLRGLTTIPHASGEGESMLAAVEGAQARILHIDPRDGYRATVELNVLDFLEQQWGQRPGYAIVAYNDMTPVPVPGGKGSALLIGLEATESKEENHTRHPKDGWRPEGMYLVRDPDRRYQLRQISDPTVPAMPPLVSTRTIAVSPFDPGILYFGGYDPNAVPAHNTAWVYAAPIDVALGGGGAI